MEHLGEHIEGSPQALKLLNKGDAVHVFKNVDTLGKVESAIFERGVFTGVERGASRFGVLFKEPIGWRISPNGVRTPLHYGEMKITENGLYHVIPRTGAAK